MFMRIVKSPLPPLVPTLPIAPRAARLVLPAPALLALLGLPSVPAGIEVRSLRPTPLGEPLQLWAQVTEAAEAEMRVALELRWDGTPRAAAQATCRRWQPR